MPCDAEVASSRSALGPFTYNPGPQCAPAHGHIGSPLRCTSRASSVLRQRTAFSMICVGIGHHPRRRLRSRSPIYAGAAASTASLRDHGSTYGFGEHSTNACLIWSTNEVAGGATCAPDSRHVPALDAEGGQHGIGVTGRSATSPASRRSPVSTQRSTRGGRCRRRMHRVCQRCATPPSPVPLAETLRH